MLLVTLCLRILSIFPILLAGFAYAYVPTAEEACEYKNNAICELDGFPYYTTEPCKPPAKTIKPLGKVNCKAIQPPSPSSAVSSAENDNPPKDIQSTPKSWDKNHIINVLYNIIYTSLFVFIIFITHRKISNVVGSIVALAASYFIAKYAFFAAYANYSSHDTFGPMLIASAFGLMVFSMCFIVIKIIIRITLNGIRKK